MVLNSAASPLVSSYDADATVVLVGFSGAGKQTLGIIASVHLQRRYVDFNVIFERTEGMTPYQYATTRGFPLYREAETRILATFLATHQKGCVFVGLTLAGDNTQRQILRDFSKIGPVIYIRRDRADLTLNHEEHSRPIYEARDGFYRSCSNFDFFNITQLSETNRLDAPAATLKLKKTETDFIRFLCRIFGQPPALLHSVEPLSPTYTYCLEVKLNWLETQAPRYEELDCGADAISLVVAPRDIKTSDITSRLSKQIAILRRYSRAPIIIDLPDFSGNDPLTYFKTLKLFLRNIPDFLTVPLTANYKDLKALASTRCTTRLIGTVHRPIPWTDVSTEPPWTNLEDMARTIGCVAVRMSRDPRSTSENLPCLRFAEDARRSWSMPLVAYNTGDFGRTTVCFNPILSPVIIQGSEARGITVKEAQMALYSSFILPRKRFIIMGKSVSYSLSPAMHNAAYAACGMPHSYSLLQTDEFNDFHRLLEDGECGGITISLPYKTNVLPCLDYISPEARQIGAANTVLVERQQKEDGTSQMILRGHNTDHIGIRECIQQNLSPANLVRDGSTALIVGAGGMARAAIHACHALGLKRICIYNRTFENSRRLVENLSLPNIDVYILGTLQEAWPKDLKQPTIIVSCIPAHSIAGGGAHNMTIPDHWLQSRTGGVFIELAYKPLVTRFIKQMTPMSTKGWIIVNGLDVLLQQGVAQFELFTGRPAPVHVMRHALEKQSTFLTSAATS